MSRIHSRILLSCLLGAVVVTAFCVPGVALAAPAPGTVEGVVTADGGIPPGPVDVYLCVPAPGGGWEQLPASAATSDPGTGAYTMDVPPGDYRLRFVDPSESYGYQFWPDDNNVFAADTITVTSFGVTTCNQDLPIACRIYGFVDNAVDEDLSQIDVTAIANVDGWWPGVATVQTNGSGYYDMGGLPPGDYLIRFDDNAHANFFTYASELYNDQSVWQYATAQLVTTTDPSPGIADATLDFDSSITGTVSAGGAALPGANVALAVQVPGPWGPEWREIAHISADVTGYYFLDGLRPDTYYLRFSDPGATYVTEYWDDRIGGWGGGDPINVGYDEYMSAYDAELALSGRISGYVGDGMGGGYSGIGVAACIPNGEELRQVAWAQTDINGDYLMGDIPAGDYIIEFQGSADLLNQYYSESDFGTRDWHQATSVPVMAGATTPGINAVMDPASHIVGTVTDGALPTPAGIAGIRVVPMRWQSFPMGGGMWQQMPWLAAVTSGSGAYDIGGLEAGDYRLFFDAGTTGWASEYWNDSPTPSGAQTFYLGSGWLMGAMDAELALGGRISGTVVPIGPGAIEGLTVVAVNTATWDDLASAQTGPGGAYTIFGLPAGAYEVRVNRSTDWLESWWDGGLVGVTGGVETPNIDITLSPACKITGYVTPEGGGDFGYDGAVNAVIVEKVLDDPGNPDQYHWEERWENPGGVTLPDGYYEIGGLVPGTYRVVFKSDDGSWAAEYWDDQILPDFATDIALENGGDIATDINAELAPAASISGRITSDGMNGLANVNVTASPYDEATGFWQPVAGTMTDADGYYAIGGLKAGTYLIDFWDGSGTYQPEFYDDQLGWENADRIALRTGWTIDGIDAVLAEAAHVSGTVRGEGEIDGLVGIDVTLFEEWGDGEWQPFGSQLTGPGGAYDFSGLQHGRNYRLWFDDPTDVWGSEAWPDASAVSWADSVQAPETEVDVELSKAGGITGIVHGGPDDSTPLGNAIVHGGPYDPATGQWDAWAVGADADDTTGEYVLTGLKPGVPYRIWAEDGDAIYAPGFWEFNGVDYTEASDIVVAGEALSTADFHLETGSMISGYVTDEFGGALQDVFVEFFVPQGDYPDGYYNWEPYQFLLAQVTTDASGMYAANGLAPGTYGIRFSTESPMYATEWFDDALLAETGTGVVVSTYGETVEFIDASLSYSGAIQGRVTNAIGQPIAGASVQVAALLPDGNWQDLMGSYAETDENGIYLIEGVRPDDMVYVHAWSNSGSWLEEWYQEAPYFEESTGIQLLAGETTYDIDFTLDPAAHIVGTVTFDGGAGLEPLQGIDVTAYRFNGESWDEVGRGWADQNGNYDIGGLAEGEYRLWFSDWSGQWAAEGYSDQTSWRWGDSVLTSVAMPGVADATLAPAGSITGTVFGGGVPIEGARVMVGPYSESIDEWDPWFWTHTDASGNYTISGLQPGVAYRVQADGGGQNYLREIWTEPAAVPPSDDWHLGTDVHVNEPPAPLTECDFNLTAASTISGTVIDSIGDPIAGAWVFLFTPTPVGWDDWWGSFQGVNAVTDGNGDYTIGGLYPGDYRIMFGRGNNPVNYESETWDDAAALAFGDTITVTTIGESLENRDATLSVAGAIEGFVTGSHGPVEGAEVRAAVIDEVNGEWRDLESPPAYTDADGYYIIDGLRPADEVFVHVLPPSTSYAEQWFDNAPYIWMATALHAPEGDTLSSIDFYLEAAGTIAGTIELEDPSGGYGPIRVEAFRIVDGPEGDEWQYYTEVRGEWGGVTPDGHFELSALPAGDYILRFSDDSGVHAPEYHHNEIVDADALPITVTPDGVVNINAFLKLAGAITGTVTDTSGSPAPDVLVDVLVWDDLADAWVPTVGSATSDPTDGTYRIPMRPGPYYRVRFSPSMASPPYAVQYYDGVPIVEAGTDVSVNVGDVTGTIDAVMTLPASLEVNVTDMLAAPLDAIEVELHRSDDGGGWYPMAADTTVGGTALFEGLLPGDYRVILHDPAGIYAATYYDVEPDGWPNDIPLLEGENGSVSQALQLVDIIVPTTTITAAPLTPDGDHDWYVTEPMVTLTSSEPGATIRYRWNSEGPEVYTTPFNAYEGTNVLTCWSVDEAGNTETPAQTRTFKLDTMNPTVPAGVGAVATSDTSVRLSWLSATDATSGIWEYLVYNASTDVLVATVTGTTADLTGLTASTAYSYYVVAVDNAGRVSARSATAGATTTGTDVTPPVTQIHVFPAAADGMDGWYVASPGVTFATGEAGTTTYYYWDSAAEAEYTVPLSAPEGQHTIHYYSRDAVGNPETEQTRAFKVDTANPTTPTGVNATGLGTTSIRVGWTAATDATSGVWHYLVYDAAADTLVATVTGTTADITGLSPGTPYSFYVVAVDNAGRVSAHSATAGATTTGTDVTPPVTQIYVFPAAADGLDGWHLSAPSILFGTGEAGTTTFYNWDSAAEAQYTVPLLAPEGQHTIHYHSRDAAGNAEMEQTFALKVDTVNPTTPTGVTAVALDTASIRVSWAAATDATSGIWHYLVYDAVTDALLTTVTGTSADITGLSPGTAYSFYVVAEDRAGREGDPSTAAGATTTGAPTTLLPVYRFYRPSTGTHFYTIDTAEMQRVRDTMSATYVLEGVGYYINTSNPANSVPLYRFYNRRTGTHLYTADEGEKNAVLANLSDTYTLEGVAYYVSMSSGLEVHRFYSPSKGVHFYSADPTEIAHVRSTLGAIWQYEGLAYHVGQ